MPLTAAEIDEFLAQPLVAVISTVDDRGRPRSAPVWFHWADGAAYVFTARTSVKWRNLERRPHASLCVDTREPPYAAVVIDGDVQPSDRPLYELVRAMAVAYYGEEQGLAFAEGYRGDKPDTVLFRVVPRHVTSWDYRDEG